MESFCAASVAGSEAEIEASSAPAPPGAAAMAIDSRAGGAAAAAAPAQRPPPDGLPALLLALAAVYGAHPALFLEEGLRYEVLGEFMGHVAGSEALTASPSALTAYLAALAALASGEAGARTIFAQLRGGNSPGAVGWQRMFQTLAAVVRLYAPEGGDGGEGGGGGAAGAGAGAGAPPQRLSAVVLPACDSAALCAYLSLFA